VAPGGPHFLLVFSRADFVAKEKWLHVKRGPSLSEDKLAVAQEQ
jgi:hypothetical protein